MTVRIAAAILLLAAVASARDPRADYDALLRRVVKKDGVVYSVLRKERGALDRYVASLADASPGSTDAGKIAFWVNAYNALTLQQVLDTREPGKPYSVQDVDGFWKRRRWSVAGRTVSLDDIEHKILRKEFSDARIHFAVNCASRSCPPLAPELYRADTLDVVLTQAARAFLNDTAHNEFDSARKEASISRIFDWFKMDFVEGVSKPVPGPPRLQQFLAQYAARETLRRRLLTGRWTIRFKKYDWSLNESGAAAAAGRDEGKDGGGSPLIWIYLIPAGLLLLYGGNAFRTLVLRRRHGPDYEKKLERVRATSPLGRSEFPPVLVQLPVYNEGPIARRVIDAAAALDWPRDRLAIQVLDDSTDATRSVVDAAVGRHAPGKVRVLRRPHRDGFKAGALAAGLEQEKAAEYVAIFDADFVPEPDFLRRALVHFSDAGVGCVQGRWAHLNREQNWLTRAQAIGLDAHFRVVQFTRAATGSLHNFMGTAGVWRRRAIEGAGGWSADTLTEDLDLSYRAQLDGWRIVLDRDLAVPSEVPPTVGAYKSQQRRWACGSIQCARKHVRAVWRSDRLSLRAKIDATLHLCGYGVCLAMAVLVMALPFATVPAALWPLGLVGLGPLTITLSGQRRFRPASVASFLLLGVGTCASNALAVLRGLTKPIDTFVRTPKQGARARPPRTAAPWLEHGMALFTLFCVLGATGRSPIAMVGYALFCSAGFFALTAYWWVAESELAQFVSRPGAGAHASATARAGAAGPEGKRL